MGTVNLGLRFEVLPGDVDDALGHVGFCKGIWNRFVRVTRELTLRLGCAGSLPLLLSTIPIIVSLSQILRLKGSGAMRTWVLIAYAALAVVITGCQSVPKQDQGALLGAVVGGVVGNQFGSGSGQVLATVAGTAIGAAAGASVGRSLDSYDRFQAQQAFEYNQTGQSSIWVNPDSGAQVGITPTKTYQTAAGQYCREYRTTVQVGGKAEQAYGTACRQPDGAWRILN